MEFKIFGLKIHVETLLITLLLVWLTSIHLVCSCSKLSLFEGMKMLDNDLGSPIKENNTKDVFGSYAAGTSLYEKSQVEPHKPLYLQKEFESTEIPLKGTMDFFQKTKFLPECCPSTYTKGDGCACLSKEQMDHINTRGGNRSCASTCKIGRAHV